MSKIIEAFTGRELALMVWLLILLIWILSSRKRINWILPVIKSFLQWKIFSIFLLMVIYLALVIYLTHEIGLWDGLMIKDIIFWFFGTAIVMFFNFDRFTKDKHFLRNSLLDNLKFIVILEFIIGLYTFNFIVEFLLLPILVFVTMLITVAGKEDRYSSVKKIFKVILSSIGLILLFYAILRVIIDFNNFASIANLKSFILLPILSVILLPFVYFVALYANYETLFVILDHRLKANRNTSKSIKIKIFFKCFLRLKKLNNFHSFFVSRIWLTQNDSDLVKIIDDFKI